MASTQAFVEYALERLGASLDSYECLQGRDNELALQAKEARYRFSSRKMFGEYCIYVSDETAGLEAVPKPIFLLCDDVLYVKQHKALAEIARTCPLAPPYPGAKPHYVLDIDDSVLLARIILTLTPLLPTPKKARK